MSRPLLIVGASTRAAAHSAIRAGYAPICADMFADVDLRAVAEVLDVADYPRGLTQAIARIPRNVPLMYTGALENQPELLEALCEGRPLLGNGPDVLRGVRDPFSVRQVSVSMGLPTPEVIPGDAARPEGDWLWKPLHGSAGRGILVQERGIGPGYWQRFQPGIPHSALYVANGSGGDCLLVGVARQLIGLPWLPFGFVGAIAPVPVPDSTDRVLERIGRCLAERFELRGIFGVDFVLDVETPWLVEINPRYTATVELFEFAMRRPVLSIAERARSDYCYGKRIVYAPERFVADDYGSYVSSRVSFDMPDLADIPAPGLTIEKEQPICSVFATARGITECVQELEAAAGRVLGIGPHRATGAERR